MSIAVAAKPAIEPAVEFAVLGPFRVRIDGDWRTPPTRQIARVGTILAGWPGDVVELDRIIAGVWGAKAPATVRNTLQVHVSHLRRLVGRTLVRSHDDGYALDVPLHAVDAEQFVEAVHEAARLRRREHFARAAEVLDQAIGRWRGTPYVDVSDPDLTARRERLAELRDQAREDLLECRLDLARDGFALADVVADAKELVARQPLREKGHALLVRALAAADRPAEASAAYEAAAAHLRERLGLDPGRTLVDVHARALARDDTLLPRAMRTVRLLPDPRPADAIAATATATAATTTDPATTAATAAAVARIRETVVDLGARTVTLVTADPAWARAVAVAAGTALADDVPTGSVVLDASTTAVADLSPAAIAARAGVGDLAGLAVVLAGWTTAANALAAVLATGPSGVFVLVADRALGLGTEVVLWDAAPAGADRVHQRGA